MNRESSSPTPAVGDVAPDFTLKSTTGDEVTLSDLRGRPVLLAFFPAAFSGTCTEEFCEIRDHWADFEERDLVVLAVSVDNSHSQREFKAKESLTGSFLSDFKREVSRSYGVLHGERFQANRAYFLIGRDGVIRWRHIEPNSGQRRATSELMAAIDAVEG